MRLTKFVALLLICPLVTTATPIDETAETAAARCFSLKAVSLVNCGTEMAGRSEEHQLARRAVRAYLSARNAFMNQCLRDRPLHVCNFETEWDTLAGINRAMEIKASPQ